MALKKRPPQHRVDAPIVFVHPRDESWDHDRIKEEQEEMKKRGEPPSMHPVVRYWGGWTRYDIEAQDTLNGEIVTAAQYLSDDKKPTKWFLRRLRTPERYEMESLHEQEVRAGTMRCRKTYQRCCETGVLKVENGPILEGGNGRRLTSGDIEAMAEIDPDLPLDVGEAVFGASLPMQESEKKV